MTFTQIDRIQERACITVNDRTFLVLHCIPLNTYTVLTATTANLDGITDRDYRPIHEIPLDSMAEVKKLISWYSM